MFKVLTLTTQNSVYLDIIGIIVSLCNVLQVFTSGKGIVVYIEQISAQSDDCWCFIGYYIWITILIEYV